jgi:hypothetical protein
VFARLAGRKVVYYIVNHRVPLSFSQRPLHVDEVEDEDFGQPDFALRQAISTTGDVRLNLTNS